MMVSFKHVDSVVLAGVLVILVMLGMFVLTLSAFAVEPVPTLRATRILTETYPCDGAPRNKTYRPSDSVGGHPPLTSPIAMTRFWSGNYTSVDDNSRVAVFRDSVNGQPAHDLLHQHFHGQRENTTQYTDPGFTLGLNDSITFDYICWGGGLQTTAVWVTYRELRP